MGVDGGRLAEMPLASRGFGPLLVAFRHAAGLTQEELAEASGVSVRAIRDMERGRVRAPQRRTASILATALGLTEDEEAHFLTAARARRVGPRPQPAPVGPGRARAGLVPRELPAGAGELIGREDELAAVVALAGQIAAGGRPATAVACVHGPPGVGKTAFAVSAGHRLGGYFPDGQLFVDLDGTGRAPLDVGEAMAHLLRSLAVPDSVCPASMASRAGLYRTLTRDRRLLVVLDNAVDEAQVRPLIPSGERCLVLVTSRRALTGLHSSAWTTLDVLAPDAAIRLLGSIIGMDRLSEDPPAASRLARLCGYLPLALRIAGNRLAGRPQWSVGHLVAQLEDQQRRLAALTAGDLGVEAAFEVSYRQLDPVSATVFRFLALVPGADFGVSLGARVAGVDEATATGALEELVDCGLLLAVGDRYRFHDLVHLFARGRLDQEETSARRAAAQGRMVDWLVENTVAAGRLFDPDVRLAAASAGAGRADDHRGAWAWLEAEATNWLAALRYAARYGRHDDVVAIARAMHWYSDAAPHRHPWDEVFGLGVEAARAAGRRHDEAVLLNFLGWALYLCRDRNEDGFEVHQRALALAREIGDRREEAWALAYSAAILVRTGDPRRASDLTGQAVDAFRAIGHPHGEHMALSVLGGALAALGRFDEAMRAHHRVLAFWQSPTTGLTTTGAQVAQAHTMMAVGNDLAGLGRSGEATDAYAEALALYRRGGEPFGQATALYRHGLAMRESGDGAVAAVSLRRAMALFESLGTLWWQALTLHALASVTDADPAVPHEARDLRERAADLCDEIDTAQARSLRVTLRDELSRPGDAPPADS